MGESKEAVFRLTNTGNNPLVILDAATTCGCARPSFNKHPAKSGETLQVRAIMTPKDKGVFDETISVKCNTNQLKGELAGYIGTITSKPPTPLLLMKQKGGDTKVVN